MDVLEAPTRPPTREASWVDRLAWWLAEVPSPAHLVILITLVSGLAAPVSVVAQLGWGFVASVGTGIIPYVVALDAIRRGKLSSRHIPERSERIRPMLWTGLSVLVTLAVLIVAGAPTSVVAVQLAMTSGMVTAIGITIFWKISMHTGVAASCVMVSTLLFGWWCLLGVLVVVGIGWSRLHTRAHTPAQVYAGVVIGAASSWPAFLLML